MTDTAADESARGRVREAAVAVLTLDRPGKLNAITPVMAAAPHRTLDAAEADEMSVHFLGQLPAKVLTFDHCFRHEYLMLWPAPNSPMCRSQFELCSLSQDV